MIDLGLVNFKDHPSDDNYKIFRFVNLPKAKQFEKGIEELDIFYERHETTKGTNNVVIYAIRKRDFEKAQKVNYLVESQFRKPFISNKVIKWVLPLITLSIIALAIIGAVVSK